MRDSLYQFTFKFYNYYDNQELGMEIRLETIILLIYHIYVKENLFFFFFLVGFEPLT
jgi:hypothetical protein